VRLGGLRTTNEDQLRKAVGGDAEGTPNVTGKGVMATTSVHTITNYLNDLLDVGRYADMAVNGLQVECLNHDVRKVGFAVDAGYSIIESAAQSNCDLLVVHHGVLWGGSPPIVGPLARKLHLCMSRGVSLYAAHLPLDGHAEFGNAAQIGHLLGVTDMSPAFSYKGATIGIRGTLATPRTPQDIAAHVGQTEGALQPPFVLPFGPAHVRTIGIATGAATFVIPECAELGLDLLVTGESKQEAYHSAKEYKMNVICMGHYASETFGVRALERVLQREFRVETCWISEPTGI
jgi:dinuclear metal center YbgI/SA1388 family protein